MKKRLLNWFKKIWMLFLKWGEETALPWLLKSWLQIVNVLIVLFACKQLYNAASIAGIRLGFAAGLVGLWGVILLAYWIIWKFLGVDKIMMPKLKAWWKKIFEKK